MECSESSTKSSLNTQTIPSEEDCISEVMRFILVSSDTKGTSYLFEIERRMREKKVCGTFLSNWIPETFFLPFSNSQLIHCFPIQ